MDPEKVDRILNWKTPTNRSLCKGFIGSVGYLADGIYKVHVPLGVLAEACAESKPFEWGFTEQRAFEAAKSYTAACAPHSRVPMDYGPGADPIWVMTDACGNGIDGVVAQGKDWRTAKVAAFYSAKMSPAQRNYPIHEQELLAGVGTMLRHREILQGTHFTWVTDHRNLEYVLTQRNLSGRQARWMEKLSSFDFKVQYVPGEDNVLPDALSRLYEFDAPGTIRAPSEFVEHDLQRPDVPDASDTSPPAVLSAPVLVGREAIATAPRRSTRLADKLVAPPVESTRRQSAPIKAKVSPVAPVLLPEGADPMSPRRRGRPPKVTRVDAPPRVDVVPPAPSVGQVKPKRGRRPKVAPLPAETGRPETGAEFAKRMVGRFVLLGPGERKKGERVPTLNLLHLLHLLHPRAQLQWPTFLVIENPIDDRSRLRTYQSPIHMRWDC